MKRIAYYTIQWISRAIAGLLAVRLVLRFFSANPVAPAVSWLYNLTSWLLQPVDSIFSNIVFGPGIFDVVALIGLVFYAIVFSIILRVFETFLHGARDII